MNCPYCRKPINAFTGFQETEKFMKHLKKCRKNPENIVLSDGIQTAVTPKRNQPLLEALEIRYKSGQ